MIWGMEIIYLRESFLIKMVKIYNIKLFIKVKMYLERDNRWQLMSVKADKYCKAKKIQENNIE